MTSLSPSASPLTSSSPLCRLEGSPGPSASPSTYPHRYVGSRGSPVIFDTVVNFVVATTSARGFGLHHNLRLNHHFGFKGSRSPSTTSSQPSTLPPTSPPPPIQLKSSLARHQLQWLVSSTTAEPSTATSTSTSSTSTTSSTCEAYLMSTSQEGLGVYWRTSSSRKMESCPTLVR
jgi:hypothetical protein